jgi:hypothetical protein
LREVAVKKAVIEELKADNDALDTKCALLTAKVEAPKRCMTLTQFAKSTEAVLGMTPPILFRYLRDVKVLNKQEATDRYKSNMILSPYSGKGLFQSIKHIVNRSVKNPAGEVIGHEEVPMETPKLTPDTKDASGEITKIGGYSWLFRKIQSDPRATLYRLVASEGGSEGVWAPLYGCRLLPVLVLEGLTPPEPSRNNIQFYCEPGSVRVSRKTGSNMLHVEGVTLERALRRLLDATPKDAPKAELKEIKFDE